MLCWFEARGHVFKRWPHPQRHPFPEEGSQRERQGERQRETQSDWQGGEGVKANILSHWQQLSLSDCFTWEKPHSEIWTHTDTQKRHTNHKHRPLLVCAYHTHIQTWIIILVRTFTVLFPRHLTNFYRHSYFNLLNLIGQSVNAILTIDKTAFCLMSHIFRFSMT